MNLWRSEGRTGSLLRTENSYIEGLKDIDQKCLPILSRTALAKLKSGDALWEEMVPPQVAKIIKERRLLGYLPTA